VPQANQALPKQPFKKGFRAPLTLNILLAAPTKVQRRAFELLGVALTA
jgi:hypothetical protein